MPKRCSKCKISKTLDKFNRHPNGKFGVRSICKICSKLYKKEFHKKYPWKRTLENINSRCNNSKYYKNIKVYLTESEIEKLWFRDEAYLMMVIMNILIANS